MMEELQLIISELQSEYVDVDDALEKYARGQKLLEELSTYLKAATNKIEHYRLDLSITAD
jgi:exodeoxyribonuclease VII small subunit